MLLYGHLLGGEGDDAKAEPIMAKTPEIPGFGQAERGEALQKLGRIINSAAIAVHQVDFEGGSIHFRCLPNLIDSLHDSPSDLAIVLDMLSPEELEALVDSVPQE